MEYWTFDKHDQLTDGSYNFGSFTDKIIPDLKINPKHITLHSVQGVPTPPQNRVSKNKLYYAPRTNKMQ